MELVIKLYNFKSVIRKFCLQIGDIKQYKTMLATF